MNALVIDLDGNVRDVEIADGDLLRALYRLIGCRTVEVVELSPDITMWLDEEGMLVEFPMINHKATYLAQRFGFVHQP
jgi:hypothetical protein